MKRPTLLLAGTLLLAACGPSQPERPQEPAPTQTLEPGFNWVQEPLKLWQEQSLYGINYWVNYDPIQLSSYSRQTYLGGDKFTYEIYSLNYSSWRKDYSSSLVFSPASNSWVEQGPEFTAVEGPVGSAGIKTVHVTDASGTKYYSLQRRDLAGKPIKDGIADGFGDGRAQPEVIRNGTAKFSAGAEAYTWVMDQQNPVYTISRIHTVFTDDYEPYPVHTCQTISKSCTTTAATLNEAINKGGWILNGGGNVAVRLLAGGKAEVRYTGEDGRSPAQTFQVGYKVVPASSSAPEHLVFDELRASDAALTAAVSRLLNVGNGKLAFYVYGGQVLRGTYLPAQTGVMSKTFQYNKQAINDILTNWRPSAPAVLE